MKTRGFRSILQSGAPIRARLFTGLALFAAFCVNIIAGASESGEVKRPPMYKMRKCEICESRGQVVLRPSERLVKLAGNGSIGTRSRFDRKVKCPVCNGSGRRKVMNLEDRPPVEDVIPCRKCGWNGFSVCKKCAGEGLLPCKARNCDNGWIFSKREKGGNGQMVAASLDVCHECGGTAKVECKSCLGAGGIVCPRCHGQGFDADKTERARAKREKQRKAGDE